ncbi:two-component system response regulator YesN [Paenibacillus shirakamiensis]|uniref:Two-component system response regulator YesN n=1 Tax=Paenibacillus shirakamiensis TaxID=1265935 RepID=A0ABS4JGN5_9BACL|nr:response regulator [Paenibacillus shirakamiensis]MBP2000200.1 two-component system response regulator YesN [Paenibacillus shirakamiensis]
MYRLIIADDDHIEREGIKFLIHRCQLPLDIREARNGRQALDMLKEEPCDVLITDIKMPFMDGLQLAKEARSLLPHLRVIILSGHGEFEYARTAISLQVTHYLLKPIEEEEFREVLNATMLQLTLQSKPQEPDFSVDSGVEREPASKGRAIDEVMRMIESEYSNDLGLEYLAGKVHLTPSYLSHIFKKATGVSLVKYINKYRMEKAREYLEHSNYKIVDVYRMVGFSDPSYFGMTFKAFYGLTPSQYRERVGLPK